MKIDHPNLIRLFEIFEDEHHYHIVTELCKGGELYEQVAEEVSKNAPRISVLKSCWDGLNAILPKIKEYVDHLCMYFFRKTVRVDTCLILLLLKVSIWFYSYLSMLLSAWLILWPKFWDHNCTACEGKSSTSIHLICERKHRTVISWILFLSFLFHSYINICESSLDSKNSVE